MIEQGAKRVIPILTAGVLLMPAAVNAQPSRNTQGGLLEEVVVTAQKVEQSIDAVPVAVSAISGDALRELGFQSSTDIAAQIPNLDVEDTGFTFLFSIRGAALNDFGDANESPVGFYVDDIYRGTLAGQNNQLFDIERVEVLRGPQGTLYGRNTTGGLVHYVTRKPSAEAEGYAQVQVGSYGQRILDGAIGGPLAGNVRARVSAKYNEDDGWQKNRAAGGGRFAQTDVSSIRGQLEVDLTDSATVLLSASYSDQDNVTPIYGYMGVLTSPTSFAQCAPSDIDDGKCFNIAGFREPDPSPKRVYTELTEDEAVNRSELAGVSGRLTVELPSGLEFVSITAYEELDKLAVVDEDSSATGAFGIGLQFKDSYGADTHQFSQEFRLTGEAAGGPWIAGLYYYDDHKKVTSTVEMLETVPGVPDTAATLGTESWAGYIDWQPALSDTLGMVVGLRYTDEEKNVDATTSGVSVSKKLPGDQVTGRIGISWAPSDSVLAYATLSTGYKSGEFNTTLLFGDISAVTAADREKVTNLELGAKWSFWEERARVRLAAFYSDTKDKQGVTIDGGSSTPSTRLINFGDVESYGGELELLLNPVDALEISLAAGVLRAEIDADPLSGVRAGWGTGASTGIGDFYPLDGTDASEAPDWTLNGIVRYGFELADAGRLTLQGDFDWQARDGRAAGNTPFAIQDSYAVVNFRAIWNSASERYYAEAFLENAFDEEYHLGGYVLAGFDYQSVFWAKPRWFGARVGVNF